MTKYSAKKTVCAAGHTHDSKLEAGRCDDLHALQAAGKIERLTLQPEFPIVIQGRPVFKYVADFAYFTSAVRIVEDVKGMRTPVFNLKKKVVEACNPGMVITLWPVPKRKTRKKAAATPCKHEWKTMPSMLGGDSFCSKCGLEHLA